jgi:hypothetical protein
MAVVPIILIVLLTAAALAFALLPMLRPVGSPSITAGRKWRGNSSVLPANGAISVRDELIARRDALYATLKDAEFDHEMGKLAEGDYQVLRSRTMHEAAGVLRQLDRLTPEAEAVLDREIEQAVVRLRAGQDKAATAVAPDVAATVEAEIAALTRHTGVAARPGQPACPNCGQTYQAGDAFCAHCGASLADGCPECGAPRRPGDAFCARCGAALGAR